RAGSDVPQRRCGQTGAWSMRAAGKCGCAPSTARSRRPSTRRRRTSARACDDALTLAHNSPLPRRGRGRGRGERSRRLRVGIAGAEHPHPNPPPPGGGGYGRAGLLMSALAIPLLLLAQPAVPPEEPAPAADEAPPPVDNESIEGRRRPGYTGPLPDAVTQDNPGAVRAPP